MKYSGEMPLVVSPSLAATKMVSNDGGVLDSETINPVLKLVHEDESSILILIRRMKKLLKNHVGDSSSARNVVADLKAENFSQVPLVWKPTPPLLTLLCYIVFHCHLVMEASKLVILTI